MFIYNINMNKTNIFKILLVVVILVLIVFFGISAFKIFTSSTKTDTVTDDNSKINVANITANNYTNVLKAVHDNLNTYVNQIIRFSGYVYRVSDFKDDEFVLARDMVINNNNQTVVVGFLCSSSDAKNYPDKAWVEITAKITKGNYHGEMPVLKVTEIKQIEKPEDELVYPPDDFYIPTNALYYDED